MAVLGGAVLPLAHRHAPQGSPEVLEPSFGPTDACDRREPLHGHLVAARSTFVLCIARRFYIDIVFVQASDEKYTVSSTK